MLKAEKLTTSDLLLIAEYTKNAGTEKYLIHLLSFVHKHKLSLSLVTFGGATNDRINQLADKYEITHLRLNNLDHRKQTKKLVQKRIKEIRAFFAKDIFETVLVSVGTPGAFINLLELGNKKFYILHTYPHGLRHRIYGKLFSTNFPKDTLLICVSEFSNSKVQALWGKKINTVVVSNGVPVVSPLLRSLQDSVTILTLGSVEKYKNPDLWLKTAIAYLQVNPGRDVKFLWAGGGSLLESMRNKVPDEYKKQVHFAGSIDNPELFFQKATLYFQPSKVESFGLAVAEALSFGVPCVVSDSGGLPEVISPTCSKTVHGSNPKEFVKAISSILNDKALYLEMSQNAVRHHSEKLSIEGWEERLSKVIGV